jgi:2-polyprenyl-3-methyl-5-hydroxy-6-metoxy-1,4-benzoquinol methylase
MEKIYDKYLSSRFGLVNEYSKQALESWYRMYDRIYGDVLPIDKNVRILDVGCGIGDFLYYLEKKGYNNFIGIDISEEQIKFCKENITENVECCDVFYFLEKNSNFDVIVMNDVLEHFKKKEILDLLELTYKKLNKHGILVIKVPNAANPFNIGNFYNDFTHETQFTKESLLQVLLVAGFSKIKIFDQKSNMSTVKSFIGTIVQGFIYLLIKMAYLLQRHHNVRDIILTSNPV